MKKEDNINHPKHYCEGGIETIDFIKAKMTKEEFRGYLKGNILKYVSRANFKGKAVEDFKKAKWYMDYLVIFEEKWENSKIY
jgi:hypothetical protein